MPGFLGLLTLIFITLKLTGYIAWGWHLVLLPLMVPFAVWLLFVIVSIIAVACGATVTTNRYKF